MYNLLNAAVLTDAIGKKENCHLVGSHDEKGNAIRHILIFNDRDAKVIYKALIDAGVLVNNIEVMKADFYTPREI